MKPLFAIDITRNKKNETVNGQEFITATADTQNTEALEARQEALGETIKASRLPLWLHFVKLACGGFGALVFACSIEPAIDLGIQQVMANAPILLIAGAVSLLIWAVLQVCSKRKEKKVLQEQNVEHQTAAIAQNERMIYEELGVPADAATIDILLFRYKLKDSEPIARTIGLQTVPYINLEVKAFVDRDCLCLIDTEARYEFPLDELRGIQRVNKRIGIMGWNKEEDPCKGIYKPYKMTVSDAGDVFFKPYYILEIERWGETYGIYFPCYELPTLERLTGLKAAE